MTIVHAILTTAPNDSGIPRLQSRLSDRGVSFSLVSTRHPHNNIFVGALHILASVLFDEIRAVPWTRPDSVALFVLDSSRSRYEAVPLDLLSVASVASVARIHQSKFRNPVDPPRSPNLAAPAPIAHSISSRCPVCGWWKPLIGQWFDDGVTGAVPATAQDISSWPVHECDSSPPTRCELPDRPVQSNDSPVSCTVSFCDVCGWWKPVAVGQWFDDGVMPRKATAADISSWPAHGCDSSQRVLIQPKPGVIPRHPATFDSARFNLNSWHLDPVPPRERPSPKPREILDEFHGTYEWEGTLVHAVRDDSDEPESEKNAPGALWSLFVGQDAILRSRPFLQVLEFGRVQALVPDLAYESPPPPRVSSPTPAPVRRSRIDQRQHRR